MINQTSKPRSDSTSLTEKLAKLEEQKQVLIKQRQEQIFDIISGTSSLAVEDELIAGALLFLVNKDNAKNPIMQEFRDLTRKHKIKLPSRRR
jgi:hypothetical protein